MRAAIVLMVFLLSIQAAIAQAYVQLYGVNGLTKDTFQNPLPTINGGVAVSNIISLNGSIPNSATRVNLPTPSSNVTVVTTVGAANLYLSFNGTPATTSNFYLQPGAGFTYSGPPITAFSILGASASGSYLVFAH